MLLQPMLGRLAAHVCCSCMMRLLGHSMCAQVLSKAGVVYTAACFANVIACLFPAPAARFDITLRVELCNIQILLVAGCADTHNR